MRERIQKVCSYIENKHNIEIIFCVENGSRAWNLSSEDSDYDVRFVFKRPLNEYLKLKLPNNVIIETFNKEGKPQQSENCYFDLLGFDIYKFGRMLLNSNPTTIEWCISNIIYYGKIPKEFKEFATQYYNPISMYHHYRSMCKENYLKYLKDKEFTTYKRYLYAMRGLVNAKYVAIKNMIPPLDFLRTIKELSDIKNNGEDVLNPYIMFALREIIELKKSGKGNEIIKNIEIFDFYIENFLKEIEAPKPRNSFNSDIEKFIINKVNNSKKQKVKLK